MEEKLHQLRGLKINAKTMRQDDLIEMQIALYANKNSEKYYQLKDATTYIEDIMASNPQFPKMMRLLECKSTQFCGRYDLKTKDIVTWCLQSDQSLEDIYSDTTQDQDLRVIAKKIALILKTKILPIIQHDILQDVHAIIAQMDQGKVIYHLAALYYLHHLSEADDKALASAREMLIQMIAQKIIQGDYDGLKSDYTTVKEQLDKITAENAKLKTQSLDHKAKLKTLQTEATTLKKRHREEKKQIKLQWEQTIKTQKATHQEAYKNLEHDYESNQKNTVSLELHDKLQACITTKDAQILQLQQQLDEQKNSHKIDITDDELLIKIEAYCQKHGMTDALLQIVYPYYQDYTSGIQPQKKTERHLEAEQIMRCLIEDGIHYCVDPQGKKHRLLNIPIATYLAQNQFVLVNQEGSFIRSFNYRYEEKNLKTTISAFIEIEKTQAKNIYNYRLTTGQIVAVDDQDQIMTFYRRIDFIIDAFIESIRSKKHKVYLAAKYLSNGLIVRQYPDMQESYLHLVSTEPITCPAVLILNDNQDIIKQWEDLSFFTLSMHYPTTEGMIEKDNNHLYIKKKNGERYLLRKAPESITLMHGDYVRVDEFNHYMSLLSQDRAHVLTDERKMLAAKKEKTPDIKADEPAIEMKDDNWLIVGNIQLADAYKLKCLKHGYRVQVVDGFEAYHKIQKEAFRADHIVIATDCLSHTNYNRIKQDFTNKIIHANNSGSNRILDVINEECPVLEKVE